jgi:hypothetical protein
MSEWQTYKVCISLSPSPFSLHLSRLYRLCWGPGREESELGRVASVRDRSSHPPVIEVLTSTALIFHVFLIVVIFNYQIDYNPYKCACLALLLRL